MRVNKNQLKHALEIVKPGLARNDLIQQSTSFAFIKDRIVTYNDEISISHPVSGINIHGAIHAEELYQLLNKIDKDEIDISMTKNEVILTCGKMKAGFTIETEIKLPLSQTGELIVEGKLNWKSLPENFIEAIEFTIPVCLKKDTMRPILTCLHINNEGFVEASDNHRIAKYQIGKTMSTETFLIPAISAKEVIKLNIIEIAETPGWVHFRTGEDTIISCRILEDSYPDSNSFYKAKGTKFILPQIISELDRVIIFSKKDFALDEHIIINMANNKLIMQSESEFGWIKEEIDIDYTGDPLTFSITPYLIKDIFSNMAVCQFCGDRLKFEGENWIYIAMLRDMP